MLQHEARAFTKSVQRSTAVYLEQRVVNAFRDARHNAIIGAAGAAWGIIRGMCLAVPGRIEFINGDRGTVRVGGVTVEAILALVPEAKVGDFAVVHAGYAIQLLSPEEAEETLELMRQVLEMEEAPTESDA
jgi:hydrogenase expression/formation protein HypC